MRAKIDIGGTQYEAELDDSVLGIDLKSHMPLSFSMSRWGDELYGDWGISVNPSGGTKEVMEIGELAYWPPGNAFCIFFGPTPASKNDEPRIASPGYSLGRIVDGPIERLRQTKSGVSVKISEQKHRWRVELRTLARSTRNPYAQSNGANGTKTG